ncbi:MAG: RnfABCDGE type electron transport complex subunit D [Bacillota bacterium]
MEKPDLLYSAPPHLNSGDTVSRAMRDVLLALVPIVVVSTIFYRLNAIFILLVCNITAAFTAWGMRKLIGKPHSLEDLSAFVTGTLLALALPPTFPWWLAVIGTFLAVGVAKEMCGGLGWNMFNPAVFGRVALIILAPAFVWLNADMAPLHLRFGIIDVTSGATPLALLKLGQGQLLPSYSALFIAHPGGSMAESSVLAVLIGGLYLLYRGHINWRTPVFAIGTVFALTMLLGSNPFYHVLAGGLVFGSFFMATDWVTTPITDAGKIIFGVGMGIIVSLIRLYQAAPEGVAFSILLMNPLVPLIDALTRPRKFGQIVEARIPVIRIKTVSK